MVQQVHVGKTWTPDQAVVQQANLALFTSAAFAAIDAPAPGRYQKRGAHNARSQGLGKRGTAGTELIRCNATGIEVGYGYVAVKYFERGRNLKELEAVAGAS